MEGIGAGVGGGRGNDVELLSKTLQVEHKLFYLDLKENPRGRYLKISEKTSSSRSTIIVPVNGISWFLELFNYYVDSDEQDVFREELQLDTKVFYFDVGENRRGRFLKGRRLVSFRNILVEIDEATRPYPMSSQQGTEPSEHLAGLSDDVGVGFISGNSSQHASELNVDRSIDVTPHDDTGHLGVSKVIRADQKRFFFDLGSNNRGHFLKISEVAGADRSSVILPLSGLKQFHEMVGHFVQITKDRVDGDDWSKCTKCRSATKTIAWTKHITGGDKGIPGSCKPQQGEGWK